MPSLVTSIIGGVQGASAAHNAADAQSQGYSQAANSVNTAVGQANPILQNTAQTAGQGVLDAAGRAGTGVLNASGAAGQGVSGAAAGANGFLAPWMQNGTSALQTLANSKFSFNPQDLQNTPGYQFALDQGLRGINSSAAAAGLRGSGATAKAAANFAEGLAGTTYQNAFNNALQGYNANINTLLPQASMGLTAGNAAGGNLIGAARYAGDTGIAGARYAGDTGIGASTYAGNADIRAGENQASNLVNAGVYTGNTQIGSGNAQAQGDVGAANSWNGMLGGIGQAANAAFGLGFAPGGGGWSPTNIASNLGNMWKH